MNYKPNRINRTYKEIGAAFREFRDKVWWNRHQNRLYNYASGEEMLTPEQVSNFLQARKKVAEIEKEYGKENLGWDDFEWGVLNGKKCALEWVLAGVDWDQTWDT